MLSNFEFVLEILTPEWEDYAFGLYKEWVNIEWRVIENVKCFLNHVLSTMQLKAKI